MRQAKNKKSKDRVAATIVLCFCLITLTSIFTIKASIDKVNESAQNLPVTQQVPSDSSAEEDKKEKESEAADELAAPDTDEKAASAPAARDTDTDNAVIDSLDQSKGTGCLPPMNKETASVTKAYAMDGLLYNKTLDQYMTHLGIDIEAPANSGVNAIAEGTITDVYEDDAYGMTVELTLSGGMVAKYSNLSQKILVEKGDVVTQGQKLGSIGQTALYESMEKEHLHFELYQNDSPLNPLDYFDF